MKNYDEDAIKHNNEILEKITRKLISSYFEVWRKK